MTTNVRNEKNENNLIWIAIDEDTYPSTILGIYGTYDEASATNGRVVGWDIINNEEVNYTTDAEEA